MLIGAIEAGGTKFVVAVADEMGNVIESIKIPTETPQITMPKVVSFLKKYEIEKIGIGCFGPISVNENSVNYGQILDTPKVAWANFNIVNYLKHYFDLEIKVDTDVNVAALAEIKFGAAKGLDSCVYITIGTGIGAGAVCDGSIIHGMLHPEMGHIKVRRHPRDDFKGICPFHNDCFEGLASGPAIEARYGEKAVDISEESIAWEIEAHYIAEAIINYIMILSPERIILGGGVSKQSHLFPKIREKVVAGVNGYIQIEKLKNIDEYIVYTGLHDLAGLKGAIALVA